MASKKPAILTPKKTPKKRNQPSSSFSSSSSSSSTHDIHDPIQHALHLDEHIVETKNQVSQSGSAAKECLTFAKSLDNEIEGFKERYQNIPELQKFALKLRQLTATVTSLANKFPELEKSITEIQTSVDLFRSSTFEYLLSTLYNDTELMAQFEKDPEIKKEEGGEGLDDDDENEEKVKQIPVRRGLLPSECR
jgi:predicted nuclease with TOPRIM domain